MNHRQQTLAILTREGFTSTLLRDFDESTTRINGKLAIENEEVSFISDLDVDADGANGQHGGRWAYQLNNHGLEDLANIGYPHFPKEYVEGLICDDEGNPIDFGDGHFASRTSLRMPGATNKLQPTTYVDSAFYPYSVLPPQVRDGTRGKVLGCRVMVTHLRTNVTIETVCADLGPKTKNGEGSIALCEALGIPSNPRSGGEDRPIFRFRVFPGVPALVRGTLFELQ